MSISAIGKVADAWATLELNINLEIWKLMDIEQKVGACATAQIGSFLPKMRALISLAAFRVANEAIITSLNKFSSRVDDLSRQRNRIIHDAWFGRIGTREPVQFVATADRKLDFGFKPVPTSYLLELIKKIHEEGRQFSLLMKPLHDNLSEFSPERFSKSEGIVRDNQ